MGLNISNKTIDKNNIKCDETFLVTLGLSASPNIQNNPTDIILILDRFGSMTGEPLAQMKEASKIFIDVIDESTGGLIGNIGNGSRIGMVSFSTEATRDIELTTSTINIKEEIDSMVAGGNTNHSDAFKKAIEMFDPLSTNKKIIIMFTDKTAII